ncbi:Leucine Rich repeats (2 copies) [Stieleria neptunia]|uniref:Leucine Rich repeats (2 copies) n=1 Tax=Stieleria neptunia TaxID=2527979 RepID=A0A518HNA4_9BACT|nr:hypothetical protein [Stieleria neptunia]QDV42321.1 Leucine Rich repeats (2 copies) [Stieleria neptunia]
MAKSFHVTAVLRTIGFTTLFALAAATSLEAQLNVATESPAADQNEPATFEVLINGLSSNKFNTRRTSYDQLVAAGSRAVGALEKGAKSDQLEVATRCVEALAQISRDPKGVEIALPALERLSEEPANQIAAIAAARVKELKTTDEERAIAKLTSLGVRVSLSKEGNATSVSITTNRQAHYLQFLPKLTSVFMRSNEITDAAIAPILDLPSISTLSFLDVSMTDDGLGKLKNLSKLRFLFLNDTQFSADGIRHLTDFPSLRVLSFQPDSLDQLKIIEGITKLDTLMISKFEFDREAVDVLNRLRAIRSVEIVVSAVDNTQWEWMSRIEIPLRIRISRVEGVSDAGWENLSRASLVYLSVYSTAIDDHSLRHLRNAKELESLSITNAEITDAGIAHLHGHAKLTTIRLSGTKVTKEGIAKLEQATSSLRRVTLNEGRRPFNLRAPSVGFTDNRTTGGRNAHLRGAITPEIAAKLKKTPNLATVFLTRSESYDEQQLKLLADVPIKRMYLSSVKITDGGWSAIGEYPVLESISMSRLSVSPIGAQAIGKIRSLKSLTISQIDFSDDAVQALIAALAESGTIEKMSIYRCERITNTAFTDIRKMVSLSQFRCSNAPRVTSAILSEFGKLPHLKSLSLSDVQFDEANLAHLTVAKQLSDLQITPHQQTPISEIGLGALCQLPSLESLALNKISISPERMGLLGGIQTLRKLSLNNSDINDESIAAMRGMSHLEELSLQKTNVSDAGVAAISKWFPKLTRLSMASTPITDDALDHINKMETLERLSVQWTNIFGGELQRLGDLEKLKWITIGKTQISEGEESQFKENHPDIKLLVFPQSPIP